MPAVQHIIESSETYRVAQYQLGWNDAARDERKAAQTTAYYLGRADYFAGRAKRWSNEHANA